MSEAQPGKSVFVLRAQCVFCNEGIADDAPRVAILMFAPADETVSYQLDGHLDCLRRAAHPARAERVDPEYFERYKRSRGTPSDD